MLHEVTIAVEVENDIRDIVTFIAWDSPQSARRFEEEFWQAVLRIAEFPNLGKKLDEFRVPLLSSRVSGRFHRYRIVYRLTGEGSLEIVRVLHGARDISALFKLAP